MPRLTRGSWLVAVVGGPERQIADSVVWRGVAIEQAGVGVWLNVPRHAMRV
jgi:hypothetical protein